MRLDKLLEGIEHSADTEILSDIEVGKICCDSRKLQPGDVFVCIKGTEKDGADYVKEAEKRGAKVIVYGQKSVIMPAKSIGIKTADPEKAYSVMWSNFCGRPSGKMKVIGITGTNGKTTVSALIADVLNSVGIKCARIGTLGAMYDGEYTSIGTMTTPSADTLYPLLKKYADMGARYAVMEVSSHSLERERVAGINFDIGVLTNITPEHLDFHGDMESYYASKKKLFSKCKKAVICSDDFYTVQMLRECEIPKRSCSVRSKEADYYADEIKYNGINGVSFDLICASGRERIVSSLPGEFSVSNCLTAAAVLSELGISLPIVAKGLAMSDGVKGRMEQVKTGRDFSVIIDYAHTPDALAKVLSSVRGFRNYGQRIVTLFGCGGDRDRSKRSLMGAIASRLSDLVIITSDNCRTENCADIIDEIMLGFDKSCPHVRIDDRRKAIVYAIQNAEKGDIILLCGKGHEEYEINALGKQPFSEREIVAEALKLR